MKTNIEYVTGIYLFSAYTCIDGEIRAEIRLKAFGGGFLFSFIKFSWRIQWRNFCNGIKIV
jgi:hypothetical protein